MNTQLNQVKQKSKHIMMLLSILLFQQFLFAESSFVGMMGKSLVCEGETVTYSYPHINGHSYNWSAAGGVGFAAIDNVNGVATFTVEWGLMGNPPNSVSVQEFSNGILISSSSLPITISGSPDPQITSNFNGDCAVDTIRGAAGRKDQGNCETVCEYSDVTYTTSLNSGSQYSWTVIGDNNGISGANTNSTTVSWAGPGQAYVIVTETNAAGCKESDTICITIVVKPTAKFSVEHGGVTYYSSPTPSNINTIEICKGGTICFDDLSTGASNWFWDFGNGNTSSQENPCETFNQGGGYMVRQIVENSCHCIDTSYIRVKVMDKEGPEIVCQNAVCGKGTFSYDAILPSPSCGDGDFQWNISNNGTIVGSNGIVVNQNAQSIFGKNITTIDVDWGSGPNGTISLSITGCDAICDKTTTVNIPIIPNSIDIEGDSIICQGEVKKFKVPCFPGTTYTWEVNGIVQNETSSELSAQFYNSGNNTISVNYNNDYLSCEGKSSVFNVRVLPSFIIHGSKKICEGETATFGSYNNSSFSWEVKDQSGNVVDSDANALSFTTISTLSPGTYSVIATDASMPRTYCNKSEVLGFEVIASPPAPTAINGPTEVCIGEAAVYSAQASSSDYLLEWEIDNNGSISKSNGSYVSVSWGSGNKSITLYQISKVKDCRSSGLTVPINDKAQPTVLITGADTVCGNTATSSPISYQTTANLDGYEWSISPFGAGSVINGQNTNSIEVIWNNYSGNANIVLKPTVCTTAYTPVSYPVYVTTPTMSIVGADTVCQNTLTSWNANFNFGTASNYSWEIESVNSASIVASGNGSTATYNFPNASGSFIVRMSATSCMLQYTEVKNIVVNPAPVANLSYSGDIECIETNTANLILSVQGVGPYTYSWYYNGNPMTTQPTGTTLAIGGNASDAGTYSVNVTDANGCSSFTNILRARVCDTLDSCTQIISNVSLGYSVAQISPTPGCNRVTLTATVSPTPTAVFWTFAGAVIATGTNPTYNFPASGVYPVKMYASYGQDTCTVIDTQTVVVPVVSDFEVNISCVGNSFEVNLINTSDVVIHSLSSYVHKWKIYDVNNNTFVDSSSSQDFLNVQNMIGGQVYNITLNESKSFNWGGQSINANCTHEYTFTMPIKAAADFAMSDSILCEGNTLNLTDQSLGNITAWNWNFGDGSSILTQNPKKTYQNSAQIFDIKLFVKDEFGCVDSITKQVDVKPNNLGGNIAVSPNMPICPGDTATLTFNNTTTPSSAPYSYLWSDNSNAISTTAQQTSTHYIAVTDKYGCFKSYGPKTVEVINMPTPIISGKNNYCNGEMIYMSANYGSNYTYQWFQNMAYQSGNVFYPSGTSSSMSIFASLGVHEFKVVISDTVNNCVDTSAIFTVTVNGSPIKPVLASNPSPACPDNPVTLSVTNPQDYQSISWSNGTVGTSTITNMSGLYSAEVTDTNGCKNSAVIPVHEMPDFCGFMCGCYSECIEVGDTFRFPGIQGEYASWRWERLDGTQWGVVSSGSGAVDDYIVTTSTSETIRLVVVTLNGCKDVSCEVDLDISICIPKCKDARAFMRDIKCGGSGKEDAIYDFSLGISFNHFGTQCKEYEVTIVPPFGSITTSPSPQILFPGTHYINGIWDPNMTYFSGGEVCFDVIVENLCDSTSCIMTTCFKVDACGNKETNSLNELEFDEDAISLYPNPSSGKVNMSSSIAGKYEVKVYSAQGRLVYNKQLNFYNAETKEIELSHLNAGIYNIQCIKGDKMISKKVVIK